MTSDIQEIKQNRERFLDLLLLADPSVELVQHYLAEGHLFVLLYSRVVNAIISGARSSMGGATSRVATW